MQSPERYETTAGEFNALLVISILCAAFVGAGVMWAVRLQLAPQIPGRDALWIGVGALVICLTLYPALRVYLRNARGKVLPLGRFSLMAVLGAVVGTLVVYLLGLAGF